MCVHLYCIPVLVYFSCCWVGCFAFGFAFGGGWIIHSIWAAWFWFYSFTVHTISTCNMLKLCFITLYSLKFSGMFDVSILGSAPWTLCTPCIRFYLTQYKKETTDPVTYQHNSLTDYPSHQKNSQMAPKRMMGLLLLQQYPPETIRNRVPVVSLATAPFTQLNCVLFLSSKTHLPF